MASASGSAGHLGQRLQELHLQAEISLKGACDLHEALDEVAQADSAAADRMAGTDALDAAPRPPLDTHTHIVSQMISNVVKNVLVSIEAQEVAMGIGKMRVGEAPSRYRPYARPKAGRRREG